MKQHMIGLIVFCAIIFAAITAMALAFDPDNSPPVDQEREYRHQRNDMHVLYYGNRYHHRSGRLGSMGNRGFRGGGLHGGK